MKCILLSHPSRYSNTIQNVLVDLVHGATDRSRVCKLGKPPNQVMFVCYFFLLDIIIYSSLELNATSVSTDYTDMI